MGMNALYGELLNRVRAACSECLDTTVALEDVGPVVCLPCLEAGKPYTPTAQRVANRVWLRVEKKLPVERRVLEVARVLTLASGAHPFTGPVLSVYLKVSERTLKDFVRTLRHDWHLPAISRREEGGGYWYAETAEQFLKWSEVMTGQAVDELTTVQKVLRSNYPDYAGQNPLGFVQHFTDQLKEALDKDA